MQECLIQQRYRSGIDRKVGHSYYCYEIILSSKRSYAVATILDKSVITCDMEGVIETFSDGAVAMFGYDRVETINKLRVSAFSPGQIVLQNLGIWLSTASGKESG